MGSMRFLLPRQDDLVKLAVECAYLAGSDGMPWRTQVQYRDGLLVVSRNTRESGRLVSPWPVPGYGNVALSTTTLIPRDKPYHLALELCRGTLSRILSHFGEPLLSQPLIRDELARAEAHFIQAALTQEQHEASTREAEASLGLGLSVIRQCLCGTQQRMGPDPLFTSRLHGFQARSPAELQLLLKQAGSPGNAVFYKSTWREAEPNPGEWDWSSWQGPLRQIRAARRRVACGPLVRFDRHDLPDWLYLWDEDFDALFSYVMNYVQTAVETLRPDVHLWYLAAGTNIETELHLGEEQRLRLTLAALEVLRKHDAQTPVLVGVRQPWGDYLGHAFLDLSPLQFADILVRADLGLSGFVLELNLACSSRRTLPRDVLEWNRLLDEWAVLGLPLVLMITLPNRGKTRDDAINARALQDILVLLRQKPFVQGVIWGQLQDDADWPGGVITTDGRIKPAWRTVGELWSPSNVEES